MRWVACLIVASSYFLFALILRNRYLRNVFYRNGMFGRMFIRVGCVLFGLTCVAVCIGFDGDGGSYGCFSLSLCMVV